MAARRRLTGKLFEDAFYSLVQLYVIQLVKGYMIRHKVKPGITGWAQVNGYRGETRTLDKMQARIDHDLDYLRNWSLRLDLHIILKTIMVVFRDRDAY